ncbi:MAG: tRNA (adenosine(37)-N6)-threonylcarbamoyltransferase complex transferase subunit TsaD [Roseiflexus sp.]|nr:tRNA (adenosine(37)-N6)-threonylcarbamoyltransferase complex transferase subunit TsaD [Roseiflexus sp.]MCS7289949.1 tRNA (adenosine(37)-N6)-threonylcarbamoyltransferase complex transferase subunit TsaD [Roseiflexus sp.]MDW8233362.1 tRNA (adenosine(37)-N6)-threonylcarbamoyltransferase complex transferase subunit TsaD [Roseiflexaceae bacterium]
MDRDFTILAIETSCDETAAAIIRGGRTIISNVVASQIDEHRRYGGIVPEVASRQHILTINAVLHDALRPLPGGWNDIHAVAATYGPGLAGALMTGLNVAKAIAWIRELPFIGVNHIEAHIYANWLVTEDQPDAPEPQFPVVALVVSGGHTLLALLEGHGRYRLLGQTRDDAAGEAFDKVARLLGLGFPGGPAIQKAAENAPGGVTLPRAWLRDSYDFSFSGLKTAVLHQIREYRAREAALQPGAGKRSASAAAESPLPPTIVARLARAFQESVVDVLVTKTVEAARAFGATEILLAGGVAANLRLREELRRRAPVPVRVPPIALCTDNAAMIGAAAFYRFEAGKQDGWDLDVQPNLPLQAE